MAQKYEYEFVRLDTKGFISKRPKEDYCVIVHEKAAEGWRLVTVVTPPSESYGVVGYHEFIFRAAGERVEMVAERHENREFSNNRKLLSCSVIDEARARAARNIP